MMREEFSRQTPRVSQRLRQGLGLFSLLLALALTARAEIINATIPVSPLNEVPPVTNL